MKKYRFKNVKDVVTKIKEKYITYQDTYNYQDSTINKRFLFINIRRILPFCIICNGILLLYFIACLSSLKTDNIRIYFLIAIFVYFVINILFSISSVKIDKAENTDYKKAKHLVRLFYLLTFSILLTFTILEIYNYHTFNHLFILCSVIAFCTLTSLKYVVFSLLIVTISSLFALNSEITGIQLAAILIPNILALNVSQLLYFNNKNHLITTQKLNNKNDALEIQLKTDYLTKVYNRYGLKAHTNFLLPYAIRSKTSISIIMIDIDLFKLFNDTFGHLEGDICLSKIAKSISNSVKSDTDLVSRFGGEEFLVFCYNVTEEETITICKRIAKNIKQLQIKAPNNNISKFVTTSMGIANSVLTNKKEYNNLIEKADTELYKAKESGRNCIFINGNKVN